MPARSILALLALLWPAAALAESFSVQLGGRVIGRLELEPASLISILDNTPLGAADGTFRAAFADGAEGRRYEAVNSDGRRITVLFDGTDVAATEVVPASERTPLSDPAAVPEGVLDPITGLRRLVEARDCPPTFRMYDGRRAIEVSPVERRIEGASLVCRLDYRVIAGPGHVSPFRLTNLRLEARYGLSGGAVSGLSGMSVSAGPFSVVLAR
ncbi:hypothetical protein E2L08_10725 [Palleronia sediminis]|uniref:Uncharacterized protein n=1 Tax=Palleronia sediminis TaxID=2547833 RepID=A0A4R6A837_9RHOB|nr:hypothetical protein [Palleronia sediminis]TDL78408.1 hypothetical protein E2L08_10725 [Palleronia sediminis]